MHVGVKILPATEPSVRAAAIEAERLGFSSVWLSERVVIPLDKPHPYEPMVDPWIGLAFVAAVTDRVQLGTSVSQIALRHPVLMARELATLDRLSGGRVIVGAGAGWVEEEFTSTGVPFADRGGRLNEHIRAMKHLWTTPGQHFRGRYYDIPPVGIIRPLTPGGPPVFVGGFTQAGFRRAAKYADGFIFSDGPLERIAPMIQQIRGGREQYGRGGPFPFFAQASPPENVDAARQMARDYAAAGIDGLILTYRDVPVPDAFLAPPARDAVRALIESGP
ncbi:MAG: TIGR03619 family F420-dependent LLM class oxidoreductase [Chloroflexi bacterium]|nr:TIGR03619 family F420-dependent LLM class oxidoreductase [Chloroflexota bacterium]